MSLDHLFSPTQLGNLNLPNRLVMAPLTRQRSLPGNVPAVTGAQGERVLGALYPR